MTILPTVGEVAAAVTRSKEGSSRAFDEEKECCTLPLGGMFKRR